MISALGSRSVDLGFGWAQQGSNLRPLGEQPPYDQNGSNPTDLTVHGSRYDQERPHTTTLVDAKWTADLGQDRKAGAR